MSPLLQIRVDRTWGTNMILLNLEFVENCFFTKSKQQNTMQITASSDLHSMVDHKILKKKGIRLNLEFYYSESDNLDCYHTLIPDIQRPKVVKRPVTLRFEH